MKTKIAISVLFTVAAFLTPAHASTVLSLVPLPTGLLGKSANLNLSGVGNPAGSSGTLLHPDTTTCFPQPPSRRQVQRGGARRTST